MVGDPMSGWEWKKNEGFTLGLKIRNKLVHPWFLTTVSLKGMGQPWKIITLSSIQWVSIEQIKNIFFGWENTTKKGWLHHATSPFLGVTKCPTQNLYCSKTRIPHRVHRGEKHGAHESNIAGKSNTVDPSGWGLETHCSSGRSECLKKGREENRP